MPKLLSEQARVYAGQKAVERLYFVGDLGGFKIGNDVVPPKVKHLKEIGITGQAIGGGVVQEISSLEMHENYSLGTTDFLGRYPATEKVDLKTLLGL